MKNIIVMTINEQGANVVEVENTNEAFNTLVSWDDSWNTPLVSICGRLYIAICSDMGKIRHDKISALSCSAINRLERLSEPFLVGDLIITKYDGVDDFESLDKKDIEILSSRIVNTKEGLKHYLYKQVLAID